jgi:hypothetical protein
MMTLSHITTHLASLAGAIAVSSVLFFVAPLNAATGSSTHYKVELAQAAPVQKATLRGVVVKCEGTACRAPIASSSPKNVCISVAREFGAVASFKAGDRDFDAEEIAACNGKGKVQVAKN